MFGNVGMGESYVIGELLKIVHNIIHTHPFYCCLLYSVMCKTPTWEHTHFLRNLF